MKASREKYIASVPLKVPIVPLKDAPPPAMVQLRLDILPSDDPRTMIVELWVAEYDGFSSH